MERINPIIECITEIQSSLMSGESIKVGLISYIQQDSSMSKLQQTCKNFVTLYESGQDTNKVVKGAKSELTKSLLLLLERGFKGEPISEALQDLKEFTVDQSEKDIANYLTILPFKAMIPLFIFQLPALLIILFGPLILSLQESFK